MLSQCPLQQESIVWNILYLALCHNENVHPSFLYSSSITPCETIFF